MLSDPAAEKLKYACYLGLFVELELPELIIQIHHRLRLHKQSRSRRRLVVHHARKEAYVFLLDRYYVSSVSHRDYGVLQMSFGRARAYHLLETGLDEPVLVPDVAPYVPELRRSIVGYLILAEYSFRYIMLELRDRFEESRDLRYHLEAVRHVCRQKGLYLTGYGKARSHP